MVAGGRPVGGLTPPAAGPTRLLLLVAVPPHRALPRPLLHLRQTLLQFTGKSLSRQILKILIIDPDHISAYTV